MSLLVVAAGCARNEGQPAEVVRPVRTLVVAAGGENRTRIFPGRVEAANRVELAFQVPGLLMSLPVAEGQKVAKGALIAQLRSEEFEARLKTLQGQLDRERAALRALRAGERPEERLRLEAQVRSAEARLSNARIEFQRSSRLLQTRSIPRADFDLAETAYRVAQEDYTAARQLLEAGTIAREEDIEAKEAEVRGLEGRVVEANIQLADTTLRAPYDGVIAQRFVEQNQNVTAKQPIVKFQDVDEIDVAVDVPETVMAAALSTADIVEILAEFSGAPGIQFPAHVKEIAQRADPVTQTFQVRVGLQAPQGINLLPGMTGSVFMTYRRSGILGNKILAPISALHREPSGQQVVWVVGAGQAVSRRPVKIGDAMGADVEILEGLAPGDRIVVAGVTFLREGMKVRDLGDALGVA
jgi:RND family efflux transporter MFP subunit